MFFWELYADLPWWVRYGVPVLMTAVIVVQVVSTGVISYGLLIGTLAAYLAAFMSDG